MRGAMRMRGWNADGRVRFGRSVRSVRRPRPVPEQTFHLAVALALLLGVLAWAAVLYFSPNPLAQ